MCAMSRRACAAGVARGRAGDAGRARRRAWPVRLDAVVMQYRRMGDSELEVSAIGFGAWEVGGQYGSYLEQEFVDAVQQALDLGVTLFDTALAYGAGRSEALLGRALGRRRSEAIVVTKGGLSTRPDSKRPTDGRYASLMRDIDDSLRARARPRRPVPPALARQGHAHRGVDASAQRDPAGRQGTL